MRVSSWLQAALLPGRWRVAGVRCSALSVWHVFILQNVGNAFVCGDATRMDMNSAAELLLYAGNSHREGVRIYTDAKYRASEVMALCRILGRLKWDEVLAACKEYVEACLRTPGHKQPVSGPSGKAETRPASAPLAWILVDYLSAGNPDRIEAAWDAPFAVACCMLDARRDIDGKDTTLESVEDEARIDEWIEKQKKAGAA